LATLSDTIDLLHLFGDATRLRLLALLARHELTVAELTTVLDLAQSRISTHLGRLREAGLVRDRRQGASTAYTLNAEVMPAEARALWRMLEQEVDDAVLASDAARAEALVRTREQAAAWPDAVAGQMERHYSPGRTWEALARGLLGLVRLGDVLDGGAGDGAVAQLIAPRARSVTCLDRRWRLVEAARARVRALPNVRCIRGDLHDIPAAGAHFDQVLLFHVLASVSDPARVLREVHRVLRPGGTLALVTLAAHDHAETTARYGHLHAGFAPEGLRALLVKAGFAVESCEVTSRERRPPYFEVMTAMAHRPTRTRQGGH